MFNFVGKTFGRYQIIEQLGEGGMATVYRAHDKQLERDVAIKIILPNQRHSELFVKRFEREAKALAKLVHPNILQVIEYGEEEGILYLVMPYIPGGTLKERMTGKPMPWAEAARILIPIAQALQYAHEQGIIHRDVKPANILLTASGAPMLSDFGTAKILEVKETTHLTSTGMGIGTPDYMAPEQWLGNVVMQSDVYALGVVFFELVTGRLPYASDTPAAVLLKQANEPLPSPKKYAGDLPDSVEQVMLKSLAKDLEDRYPDMFSFLNDLEDLERYKDVISGELIAKPKGQVDLETGDILAENGWTGEQRIFSLAGLKWLFGLSRSWVMRYWWMLLIVFGLIVGAVIGFTNRGDFSVAAESEPTNTPTENSVESSATSQPVVATHTRELTPSLEVVATATPNSEVTPTRTPLPTMLVPTPLWALLPATYTPTPLYVNTPHPENVAVYDLIMEAYQSQDWEAIINLLADEEVIQLDSPDLIYYLAEAYRFDRRLDEAHQTYNRAINLQLDFAPAYVGRAKISLEESFEENWESARRDLYKAIQYDPYLPEARLLLAGLDIRRSRPDLAVTELKSVSSMLAYSPHYYLVLAEAYLAQGSIESALENARHANDLDTTLLEAYRLLGQIYVAGDNLTEALWPLRTYTLYVNDDAQAWAWLGQAYHYYEETEQALEALNTAVGIDNRLYDAHLQRGLLYLDMEEAAIAQDDLSAALISKPSSFSANLGMGRALFMQGKYSPAADYFTQAERYAQEDKELVSLYYWRALALDGMGESMEAAYDWQRLLDLPAKIVPSEWLAAAQEGVEVLATETSTPVTHTPTLTRQPTNPPTLTPTRRATQLITTATRLPTLKPSATSTRLPTMTPSYTPTRKPTSTP